MSINHRKKLTSQLGFTLFELVIGITILSLIVAAIYGIVHSTMVSADGVKKEQAWTAQSSGLFNLLGKTFRELPSGAVIEGRIRKENGKDFSEVVLKNAPHALTFGKSVITTQEIIIASRPQLGGLLQLSLVQTQTSASGGIIDSERPPLILFSNLKTIEWEYFDSRSKQWQPTWKDIYSHPALIKLVLTPARKDRRPLRFVFPLPPLVFVNPARYQPTRP